LEKSTFLKDQKCNYILRLQAGLQLD
jgi:hypothetical protein